MQQGVQTDASCNIQQCWELLPTKLRPFGRGLRLRANGRHIVDQQLPTLFNVTCCVRLHILFHVVGYCCVLLRKVGNRSNFSANNSQPFFLFHDRRRVAQQCGISCWIRLHSSSNINGARHAHYAWFTKTYELHPTHGALQVPTLLGVVASVCRQLPTRTQQLPIVQRCWELLRPFARSLRPRIFYLCNRRTVQNLLVTYFGAVCRSKTCTVPRAQCRFRYV